MPLALVVKSGWKSLPMFSSEMPSPVSLIETRRQGEGEMGR
jgi:hypothetical protein